ncbi:glyceraldehyde-3-phosphate dehydrogenase [Exiguobacterium marinum]|uniref:glyceraldehyde-3-phosphate dehydrogenase n=1 Tax=Exiguobacterium marinum TaxID=273528 RepID=UPI000478C9FE|nr:glyceraldehyde-3-phosphate dehydrogenase [Exiguobacterium marinum]
MGTKVAINGFGRIGRMVFRKLMIEGRHEVVAINASYPAETLAHLIKHDSIHGPFELTVRAHGDTLEVDGKRIELISERDPSCLPWADLEIDIVVEATGKFNSDVGARLHLDAGAKKVILTAPGKGDLRTIVMGVNDRDYRPEEDHIISNASCTTNCLGPVVKVLHSTFGIETGLITTVHAYTNDQNNIDNPHKDLRRARACGNSIIPTSTGAAKAIGLVLPELQGKLNGMALRVPTPNVSLVDLVVELHRDVTIDEVNKAFERASFGEMTGILGISQEPLVSIDFNGDDRSSIIDMGSTMVLGGNHVKVLAWYDNEWGYSCRVVDLLDMVASYLQIGQRETHV